MKEIHVHKADESSFYKENNTWMHRDMEFLFECSTQCLASEQSSCMSELLS